MATGAASPDAGPTVESQSGREPFQLRSFEFRKERQKTWLTLDRLIARVEKSGVTHLTAEELAQLPVLYRATLSSLSVARSISLDRNLIEYLESLAARTFAVVYGTKQGFWESIGSFFGRQFPRTFRRFGRHIALAAAIFFLGGLTAYALVTASPEWYYSFVPSGLAGGRTPGATTEFLREGLYDVQDNQGVLLQFTAYLFRNNSLVTIFAYSLGFALGLPVLLLVFYNGLILGAFGALYHSRGLGLDLWGWILPHGVPELLAIFVGGGGGLVIAQGIIFPGRYSRRQNLARRGRETGVLIFGAIAMLFMAAFIEGFFRQSVTDIGFRYAVATGGALFFLWYFGRCGRRVR